MPDAIAHYEAALRRKPDNAAAHDNLASVLAKITGRRDEAIAHFKEALRLKPDNAAAHNNLANLLATIPGRRDEAVAEYEEALRLKPDSFGFRINTTLRVSSSRWGVLTKRHHPPGKKPLEAQPGEPRSPRCLGKAKGMAEPSILALKEAPASNPFNQPQSPMKIHKMRSTARHCLALALAALGNALPARRAGFGPRRRRGNGGKLTPLPDPEGFSGGVAGVSGGALLFAGGSNFVGKRPWDGGTKFCGTTRSMRCPRPTRAGSSPASCRGRQPMEWAQPIRAN